MSTCDAYGSQRGLLKIARILGQLWGGGGALRTISVRVPRKLSCIKVPPLPRGSKYSVMKEGSTTICVLDLLVNNDVSGLSGFDLLWPSVSMLSNAPACCGGSTASTLQQPPGKSGRENRSTVR